MSVYRTRVQVDGMEVEIEAESLEELKKAVSEAGATPVNASSEAKSRSGRQRASGSAGTPASVNDAARSDAIEIVNLIKDHEYWSQIQTKVLDKKAVLPRVLMVGYFADMTDEPQVSSGDVEAVTGDLGVRISMSNAATCFKKQANRFFTSDRVRRPGQKVRYRINRAGKTEFERILSQEK